MGNLQFQSLVLTFKKFFNEFDGRESPLLRDLIQHHKMYWFQLSEWIHHLLLSPCTSHRVLVEVTAL